MRAQVMKVMDFFVVTYESLLHSFAWGTKALFTRDILAHNIATKDIFEPQVSIPNQGKLRKECNVT